MEPTKEQIESAAIAAYGTKGWGNLSGEEQEEWRQRIKAAVPFLLPDEPPTEILEHPLPGQSENDPLSRLAIAVEISAASVTEGLTILRAMAARDPRIDEEVRRLERERQKPTPPPPPRP